MKNQMMRATALLISFSLIHVSVGPEVWAQWTPAANVSAPVNAANGGASAAAGTATRPQNNAVSAMPTVTAISAGQAFLSGPAAIPALPVSAVNAAAILPAAAVPARSAASTAEKSSTDEKAASAGVPAAAPAASDKAALETGPKTAAVGRRAAARFAELKKFFTGRSAQATPVAPTDTPAVATDQASPAADNGLRPASTETLKPQSGGDRAPPAAAPTPEDPGSQGWFGLGKAAVFFIVSLIVAQIGVEALGAAMPALVQKTFGDFTVVAELGIFASIAGIVGRQLGPMVIQKLGLRKTYLAGTATRIVSISILSALLATGHMTLPLMMVFYSLNGLIGGVTLTAESSIPPALIGQNQAKIEKFWTWEQTLLEIIGVAGPIATGALVVSMGFLPALIAFPVALGVALAILFFTLRIPAKLEALRLADNAQRAAEGNKPSVGNIFKEFFSRVGRGAKMVWHDPLLKTSFLAYTVYMMLNPFLYTMLAPAYGITLVGADKMAEVYGMLTGLYSLGGLLGGFLMMREQTKINDRKKGGMSDAEESEYLRGSMLKWMKWGIPGLLAVATLALPLAPLATVFVPGMGNLTLTLPALALIPFGIAQVISTVKLRSFFQAKVPEGQMADAMGFFGSASLAVSTIGLLALKYLFKGMSGFTPFIWIAAALIPLGIYYLYLTRHLDKVSREPGPKQA